MIISRQLPTHQSTHMRKGILNALKTRFYKYGLSDSVLEKIAAWLEPSVKEEKDIETAIAGVEPVLSLFQSGEDAHKQEKSRLRTKSKSWRSSCLSSSNSSSNSSRRVS